MNNPRLSVAGLLGVVGLFAYGLACLLNASSPWAGVVYSAFLSALIVAPIGIVYRRGGRRAFWVGFAICGWSYAVLGLSPWFINSIRPLLVTSKVLKWAHPLVIPKERQDPKTRPWRTFKIANPVHGADIEANTVRFFNLDVLVQEEGKDRPTPLVEDVRVINSSTSEAKIYQVEIVVDPAWLARLEQARGGHASFVIRRHVAVAVSPFAGLWSSPPVLADDFERVGHVFCGIACAMVGGWLGRYFRSTCETG